MWPLRDEDVARSGVLLGCEILGILKQAKSVCALGVGRGKSSGV